MTRILEKISDSELEVMKVLWQAQEPLPIAQIRIALQQRQGWEPTTVKTLVQRLCKKGAVLQEKRNIYYYRAAVNQDAYNDWASHQLINKLYEGSASSFVAALVNSKDLSKQDIDQLKALLEQY